MDVFSEDQIQKETDINEIRQDDIGNVSLFDNEEDMAIQDIEDHSLISAVKGSKRTVSCSDGRVRNVADINEIPHENHSVHNSNVTLDDNQEDTVTKEKIIQETLELTDNALTLFQDDGESGVKSSNILSKVEADNGSIESEEQCEVIIDADDDDVQTIANNSSRNSCKSSDVLSNVILCKLKDEVVPEFVRCLDTGTDDHESAQVSRVPSTSVGSRSDTSGEVDDETLQEFASTGNVLLFDNEEDMATQDVENYNLPIAVKGSNRTVSCSEGRVQSVADINEIPCENHTTDNSHVTLVHNQKDTVTKEKVIQEILELTDNAFIPSQTDGKSGVKSSIMSSKVEADNQSMVSEEQCEVITDADDDNAQLIANNSSRNSCKSSDVLNTFTRCKLKDEDALESVQVSDTGTSRHDGVKSNNMPSKVEADNQSIVSQKQCEVNLDAGDDNVQSIADNSCNNSCKIGDVLHLVTACKLEDEVVLEFVKFSETGTVGHESTHVSRASGTNLGTKSGTSGEVNDETLQEFATIWKTKSKPARIISRDDRKQMIESLEDKVGKTNSLVWEERQKFSAYTLGGRSPSDSDSLSYDDTETLTYSRVNMLGLNDLSFTNTSFDSLSTLLPRPSKDIFLASEIDKLNSEQDMVSEDICSEVMMNFEGMDDYELHDVRKKEPCNKLLLDTVISKQNKQDLKTIMMFSEALAEDIIQNANKRISELPRAFTTYVPNLIQLNKMAHFNERQKPYKVVSEYAAAIVKLSLHEALDVIESMANGKIGLKKKPRTVKNQEFEAVKNKKFTCKGSNVVSRSSLDNQYLSVEKYSDSLSRFIMRGVKQTLIGNRHSRSPLDNEYLSVEKYSESLSQSIMKCVKHRLISKQIELTDKSRKKEKLIWLSLCKSK